MLLVLAVVVGGVVFVWRLRQGPVDLDLLRPYLEAALGAPDGSVRVRVGATELVWEGDRDRVEVRVRDVTAVDAEGRVLAALPAVEVWLGGSALLHGAIEPSEITLDGARVRVVRQRDGRVDVGIGTPAGPALRTTLVPMLAARLGAATTPSRATLTALRSDDAAVVVVDRAARRAWRAARVDVELRPDPDGLDARLRARVVADGRALPVRAVGGWRRRQVVGVALRTRLGDDPVRLRGRLRGFGAAGVVGVDAAAPALALGDLLAVWPASTAPDARAWLRAHTGGGVLREMTARLTGTVQHGDPASVTTTGIVARAGFDGLTVRDLGWPPPVTSLAGTVAMTPTAVDVRVARGRSAGLDVVSGTVQVPLKPGSTKIPVTVRLRGGLAAVLTVLDRPPLGVAAALGIAPRTASGTVTGEVRLDVPFAAARWASVQPRVSADVRGAAAPAVLGRWPVAGADVHVGWDGAAVTLDGTARIAGIPMSVRLRDAAGRRQVTLRGQAEAATWAALADLDAGATLRGPLTVAAEYTGGPGTRGRIALDVDLQAATIDANALDLRKAAGTPGRAEVTLTLDGEAVTAVERFDVQAAGARIQGQATRSRDGKRWRTVDAEARIPPGGPGQSAGHFALTVRPGAQVSAFTVTSDDAGALVRSLGTYSDAEGGTLRADGTVDLETPGMPWSASVDLATFTLTRSPVLARIATLASLSGIGSALGGHGVTFDRLTTGLSSRRGVLTVSTLRAAGPSIAFTLGGTVDRPRDALELEGTVIPSYYGLNAMAGKVPILGRLLAGVGKEGVQVVDFTIRGTPAEPRVAVRPSSLAPGVVRDLLRLLPK